MHERTRWGFTLIELLTVIAIIAILFSLVAVVAPRVLEKAKIARCETTFKSVANALATYQTQHASLPPGYGYLVYNPDLQTYIQTLEPYTAARYINILGVLDMYDDFSPDTHDANGNDRIDLLEYCPVGAEVIAGRSAFPAVEYDPGNPGNPAYATDVARQLVEKRPFIYIPVNSEDALNVQRFYENTRPSDADFLDKMFARVWDESVDEQANPFLARINRGQAPANFDAFALVSMGPVENTFGVVPTDIKFAANPNRYYINALRAYYLATRDADRNGELDFDYRARASRNEGAPRAYEKAPWAQPANGGAPLDPASAQANAMITLPDGSTTYGPMIFKIGG